MKLNLLIKGTPYTIDTHNEVEVIENIRFEKLYPMYGEHINIYDNIGEIYYGYIKINANEEVVDYVFPKSVQYIK